VHDVSYPDHVRDVVIGRTMEFALDLSCAARPRWLSIKGLGEGTGLLGLPGDWTPPSRFVRATAIYVRRTYDDPTPRILEPHDLDLSAGAATHAPLPSDPGSLTLEV
jgi:penicillin V acylase-like amidase (Ntn superfamily)